MIIGILEKKNYKKNQPGWGDMTNMGDLGKFC